MSQWSRREFLWTTTPLVLTPDFPRLPVAVLDPEGLLSTPALEGRVPVQVINNPKHRPSASEIREARGVISATSRPDWVKQLPKTTHVYWLADVPEDLAQLEGISSRCSLLSEFGFSMRNSVSVREVRDRMDAADIGPKDVRWRGYVDAGTPPARWTKTRVMLDELLCLDALGYLRRDQWRRALSTAIDRERLVELSLPRADDQSPGLLLSMHTHTAVNEFRIQFVFSAGLMEIRFPAGALSLAFPWKEPVLSFLPGPHLGDKGEDEKLRKITDDIPRVLANDDPAAANFLAWADAVWHERAKTRLFTGRAYQGLMRESSRVA